MMSDVERGTLEQGVAGLPVVYRYLDPASPEEEAEVQAGELSREPGCEAERAVVLAHATEPGHRGYPGSGPSRCTYSPECVEGEFSEVRALT